MIKNLDEINRLLFIFDQYDLRTVPEKSLLKLMSGSPVVSQSVLDHKATIDFCLSAGLLNRKGERLSLTLAGRHLTELAKSKNPHYLMDFNKRESDYINLQVFLSPDFVSPIRSVLRDYFERDDYSESWKYDYVENPSLPLEFIEFVNPLKQSGLLLERGGSYEISPRYSPKVSLLVAENPTLSGEELDHILEHQKQTGRAAEELVVKYEKDALRKRNCHEEADLVARVSDWDVAAGYDIKSFSGPSRTKRHDKFIEVKGSTGKAVRFIWSANEIEKARQLRKKYWIYFLGGIGKQRETEPLKFQDPGKSILGSRKFEKRCIGYEITMKAPAGA